jgi:hypothetical protein
MSRRWQRWLGAGALLLVASPLLAPELLAFPHHRRIGEKSVQSVAPVAANGVRNGAAIGGHRSLSGVIAHKVTHRLMRRTFGWKSVLFPPRMGDGYADHVAQGSSLTAIEAAALQGGGKGHPAILRGRQLVAERLTLDGGSVTDLFEGAQ